MGKPEACCYERSRGVTEEYGETWCPAHSVCPKQCPKGYRLCEYDDLDDYGCKVAPRCVYKGKNKMGTFCPGNCPPICKEGETLVADGVDQNGCEICPKCQPQYERSKYGCTKRLCDLNKKQNFNIRLFNNGN